MNDEYLDKYETTVRETLTAFLRAKGEFAISPSECDSLGVDEMLPDAVDIEEKWEAIGQAYLPDGVREFNGYPMVSLGWMMFIGMAMAKFWDEDWERYSKEEGLYAMLRDVRGYDCMDEYICEDVLKLSSIEAEETSKLVGDMAQIANRSLMREGFESGTPAAFHAYVRTLHQLYLLGAAVQLKRMGYKMTKM